MYTYKFILFILFTDVIFVTSCWTKDCIIPSMQRLLALQWPWKQCNGASINSGFVDIKNGDFNTIIVRENAP